MSIKSLNEFYKQVEKDPNLKVSFNQLIKQYGAIKTKDDFIKFTEKHIIPMASSQGYTITIQDILQYEKNVKNKTLSNEELDQVSGGSINKIALLGFTGILSIFAGSQLMNSNLVNAANPESADLNSVYTTSTDEKINTEKESKSDLSQKVLTMEESSSPDTDTNTDASSFTQETSPSTDTNPSVEQEISSQDVANTPADSNTKTVNTTPEVKTTSENSKTSSEVKPIVNDIFKDPDIWYHESTISEPTLIKNRLRENPQFWSGLIKEGENKEDALARISDEVLSEFNSTLSETSTKQTSSTIMNAYNTSLQKYIALNFDKLTNPTWDSNSESDDELTKTGEELNLLNRSLLKKIICDSKLSAKIDYKTLEYFSDGQYHELRGIYLNRVAASCLESFGYQDMPKDDFVSLTQSYKLNKDTNFSCIKNLFTRNISSLLNILDNFGYGLAKMHPYDVLDVSDCCAENKPGFKNTSELLKNKKIFESFNYDINVVQDIFQTIQPFLKNGSLRKDLTKDEKELLTKLFECKENELEENFEIFNNLCNVFLTMSSMKTLITIASGCNVNGIKNPDNVVISKEVVLGSLKVISQQMDLIKGKKILGQTIKIRDFTSQEMATYFSRADISHLKDLVNADIIPENQLPAVQARIASSDAAETRNKMPKITRERSKSEGTPKKSHFFGFFRKGK